LENISVEGMENYKKEPFLFSKLRVVLVEQKAFDQVYTNWIVIGCKKKIGILIHRRGKKRLHQLMIH
jgi:hypothetical protein